jgi:hypothetical protein
VFKFGAREKKFDKSPMQALLTFNRKEILYFRNVFIMLQVGASF